MLYLLQIKIKLLIKASQEIYKKLGYSPYGDFGGYVVSITDKD
nr:MAG TPA: acetyltransferase domain containing protein [Microviridae sp.]